MKEKIANTRIARELGNLSGQFFAGSLPRLLVGLGIELVILWSGPLVFFGYPYLLTGEDFGWIFAAVSGFWLILGSTASTYYAPPGNVFQRSALLTALFLITLGVLDWYILRDIPTLYYIAAFFVMYAGYRCGWSLRSPHR